MARGVANKKVLGSDDDVKVTIVLHAADYAALVQLGRENYRDPNNQASYLLAKVLREAGRTNDDHVQAMLAMRAKQAGGEG
jgi:hypothetical protein